jgi:NADPH-dependent glutamate synthase beta subunit-like oxidoreductase/Pyruvate/2-oxoacid:ferredoxin oxidoreductase delta subunit
MKRFLYLEKKDLEYTMLNQHRPILKIHDPFVPISSDTSLIFKTGGQRSERPLFINKVAPCRHTCPIGIDIPTAFYRASQGDIDGALHTYLQDNPLPGVCGRVCYHPCETECNRGHFDESLTIRSLERFLSDHGHVDIPRYFPIHSKKETVAVIGSGPAGLGAAYHLARLGYRVTIFEAKSELGGMLRYGIPSYRLPPSILESEIEKILSLGIQAKLETTAGKDVSWKDLESFDAVFISPGLQSGKTLFESDGSKDDILTGLDFLIDPRKWALEDPQQKTLIIGGGNVAIDAARTLLRLRHGKEDTITVVCPESRDQMPALPEEIKEALEEGITIVNGWAPHTLHREDGRIFSLDFHRAKVQIDEESGTVEIIPVGKDIQSHRVDKIIVATGQCMNSENLPPSIEIKHGRIVTDRFGRTSLPQFFSGGDAIRGKAFAANAIAGGKMGAFAISCFLEGRDIEIEFQRYQIGDSQIHSFPQCIGGLEKDTIHLKTVVSFDQINTLFFSKNARNNPDKLEPETRKKTFEEVTRSLKQADMEEETSRCFHCGTCIDCEICLDFCPDISIIKDAKLGIYSFDSDYCKGCGVCSVACPRNVIEMVGET